MNFPVPVVVDLMGQAFVPALRPSTLLGHLVSCAPHHLPSVHESAAGGLLGYLFSITAVSEKYDSSVAAAGTTVNTSRAASKYNSSGGRGSTSGSYIESVQNGYDNSNVSISSNTTKIIKRWNRCSEETEAWQSIQASVDILIQRAAVVDIDGTAKRKELRAWADALLDIGSQFF